jgi:carbon-monoxide dehydrogenase medium subunit
LGDEAKALAGGQSLVPLMNFRLARPARLVDLNLIAELSYLRVEQDVLRIGAMTRQRELERAPLVADGWPLLQEATAYIGHAQIRNRGTVGGSLAHADPAAELPAVMAALDAELVVRGRRGERTLRSDEFFLGYLSTALAADELLVEIRVPALPPRTGWAFVEVSRRHGDFALVGVAALLTLGEDGTIREARLAFSGAAPTPLRAARAEALLVGERPAEPLFREAGLLASPDLEPESDLHASADYRREVGGALARRALVRAAARAGQQRN